MLRPTEYYHLSKKDKFYLAVAEAVSKGSKCIRAQVGAVIVKDDEIISTGYAGAPRGEPDCKKIGKCFRQEHNIPSGSDYLLCRSVHAETNACLHAGRQRAKGGTLYMFGYGRICEWCSRIILNTGIARCVIGFKDPVGPLTKVFAPEDLVYEPEILRNWTIEQLL